MKAADTKSPSARAKNNAPFFSKKREQSFFGSSTPEDSFFPGSNTHIPAIQTKLTVGQPGDHYEKQADSMADQVVQRLAEKGHTPSSVQTKPIAPLHSITPLVQRKPIFESEAEPVIQKKNNNELSSVPADHTIVPVQARCESCKEEERLQKMEEESGNEGTVEGLQLKPIFESNAEPPEDDTGIQRKCSACEKKESLQKKPDSTALHNSGKSIENTLHNSRGSGSPLPSATKDQMNSSFGADFNSVRIHEDSSAVQMNKDLHAQAFTHGSDIYFNSGKFNTSNREGQHLLAHELTHVIQQKSNSMTRGNAMTQTKTEVPGIQRQSVRVEDVKKQRGWIEFDYSQRYKIYSDIQWHFNAALNTYELIIFIDDELRKSLTPELIAAASTLILRSGIEVEFQTENAVELMKYLRDTIEEYNLTGNRFFIRADSFFVGKQFKTDPYNAYFENLKAKNFNVDNNYLIAYGNFPDFISKAKTTEKNDNKSEQPGWAAEQKSQLDLVLKKAKQRKTGAEILPDNIVVWQNEKTKDWFINVWVNYDSTGKKKAVFPVKMKPGESAEKLLDRVRQASSKALNREEDEERQKRAVSAPDWARKLESDVKRQLDQLRSKDKKATDFPDGVALAVENEKVSREGNPGVILQIWVERGETNIQRNYGAVPLTEKANASDIVPYIRRMSAVLRQYENVPGKQHPPPEGIEINFKDISGMALAAFPAQLIATDLRDDDITVTGAHNQFNLQLNYEAVYGAGPLKDLYIASKLYQQYIHFYFEIYHVPPDLALPKGMDNNKWRDKWNWLYLTYNPNEKEEEDPKAAKSSKEPAKELPAKEAPAVPSPGSLVYKTDGPDSRSRVRFPEEAGDYLVRAYTGHASIGEHSLKRMSSQAWYPVRTKPLEQEGRALVTRRTGKIVRAEDEIKAFEKALAGDKLDAKQKKLLEGSLQFKKDELHRLENAEKQTLSESTSAEISFAETTLKQVRELEDILPAIMDTAKKNKTAPSDLIEKTELLTIYWFILTNNKTVQGYQKELEDKLKQLRGLLSRSEEFKSEFDQNSPYQYNLEAAFVSTITGKIYPLTIMIGQAPQKKQVNSYYYGGNPMPQTFYNLVDVTAPETTETYRGFSYKTGPEGHKEAIDSAFRAFGKKAVYGEGKIAVRFPPGKVGKQDPNHPGTEVKFYPSEEGILQMVLKILAIVALVAGIAAIAATGVGAPAAALLLGTIAGIAGAVTSIHSLSERADRHKLEWDAETALDIISIISVIPLTIGARIATLPRTVANFQKYRVATKLLEFYGWSELGATVYLVPTKMAEDIKRIELDTGLTDDQKKKMIEQAQFGAFQTGIMMIGSIAAARVGAKSHGEGFIKDEEIAGFRQQIDLLELEGAGEYQTMAEKGWVDPKGNWTELAPDIIRQKSPATETKPAPGTEGKTPVTEPPKQTGGKTKELPEQKIKPETETKPPAPEQKTRETEGSKEQEAGKDVMTPKVEDEKGKIKETKPDSPEQKVKPEEDTRPDTGKEEKIDENEGTTDKAKESETKNQKAEEEKAKATETVQDKNIREAEENVDRAADLTKQYENDAKTAKEELEKAKENWKVKKGKEKKEAKKLLEEAKSKSKYAEEVLKLAMEDETVLKFKASGLRQEKYAGEVAKARAIEEPVIKRITDKVKEKKNNTARLRKILKEREKARDYLRNEDPQKTREDNKAKEIRVEEIKGEIEQLNEKENKLNKEIRDLEKELTPLQEETNKKLEILQAEERASIGVTRERYAWLRDKSPSGKIRKKYNSIKIDAIYGIEIEGTPHADHIVSMNEITQMKGFSSLHPEDQLKIMNHPDNFMALDGRVNSSKGDRSFSEWKGYPPLGEIPPKQRKALLEREAAARKSIEKEIKNLSPIKD